jgi:hypothetical protein
MCEVPFQKMARDMKITGFLIMDGERIEIPADAHGNNVAFAVPNAGIRYWQSPWNTTLAAMKITQPLASSVAFPTSWTSAYRPRRYISTSHRNALTEKYVSAGGRRT